MLNIFQNKRAQILYKAALFIKRQTIFLSIHHALARDSGKLTVPSIKGATSQPGVLEMSTETHCSANLNSPKSLCS